MNCCEMTYGANSFDVVFDKATLDAIMCGPDSTKKIESYLTSVSR